MQSIRVCLTTYATRISDVATWISEVLTFDDLCTLQLLYLLQLLYYTVAAISWEVVCLYNCVDLSFRVMPTAFACAVARNSQRVNKRVAGVAGHEVLASKTQKYSA